MTPRQKWFVFDTTVDGFTIVVRLLKMIFNVQTPKNIYDFAIWNDNLKYSHTIWNDNFHTFTH